MYFVPVFQRSNELLKFQVYVVYFTIGYLFCQFWIKDHYSAHWDMAFLRELGLVITSIMSNIQLIILAICVTISGCFMVI